VDTPKEGLLTADGVEELLAGDDRATVDVYIPEWKKTIRLRQMTAAEMFVISEADKKDGMFLAVSMCAVDANGNLLFKDPERLRGKSANAMSVLQNAVMKLNGLSVNAAALAKNG
jgi:hypothetical protein